MQQDKCNYLLQHFNMQQIKLAQQYMNSFKQNLFNIKNCSFQNLQLNTDSKNEQSYKKHKRVKTFTEPKSFDIFKSPVSRLKFHTERKIENIKTQNLQFRSSNTYSKHYSQFDICTRSLKNIDISQCKSGQRIAKFKYNKYYIHPNNRLKRVMTQGSNQIQEKILRQKSKAKLRKLQIQKNQKERDKVYNKFYYESYRDQQKPFKSNKNQRFQIIQKLANDNVQILQKFSKEMIHLKKRIPKIVQIIMQKKKDNSKSLKKQRIINKY